MLEKLELIDWTIFYYINNGCSNAFFDHIMPVFRDAYTWMPIYLFIALFVYINFKSKFYQFMLPLLAVVGASDFISARILKPLFARSRPCQLDGWSNWIHNLVHCGTGYSFPSNHATNHFALSFFLMAFIPIEYRMAKYLLFFWALAIGFGQIYVGLHFPFDVFAGGILGACVGAIGARITKKHFFAESVLVP